MSRPDIVLCNHKGEPTAIRVPGGGFTPHEVTSALNIQGKVLVKIPDNLSLSQMELKPGEILHVNVHPTDRGPIITLTQVGVG